MAISTIGQNGLTAPLTLTAPILGTPASINLTNATALPASAMPAGSVIQTVFASNSAASSTTSGTYGASNLQASITPTSNTNKILITISATLSISQLSAAGFGMGVQLNRGATPVFTDGNTFDTLYIGPYANYIGSVRQRTPLIYLDSPATTGSTTYTLYFAAYQGTAYVGQNSSTSFITLQEIKA